MTAAVSFVVVADKRAYGTGTLYVGKDGCWWARWRTSDGRRPHRKLGRARVAGKRDGITKKEAEAILRELMLTENAGSRSGKHDPTVEQLGRALVARLERNGRKPSTIESVRGHLGTHIAPLLGDIPVSQITEQDVERLIERMRSRGLAPKTIRNVIGTMHSLMALAVRERFAERNPAELAELPIVRRSTELRFLTSDELERVLAAHPYDDPEASQSERDHWPVVRLLVLAAALTGMRLGELRGLRWGDLGEKVRVQRSYVRGQYGEPKSRRSARAIPLSRQLLAELEAHHKSTVWNQDHDLVFAHPHTGNPLHASKTLEKFKAALRRAGVRQVRLHDLRHTFATTVAANRDVGLRKLQEWMGHENLATTEIYADFMPGEREADMIDSAFGLVRGGPILAPDTDSTPRKGR